jgi:acyl-CoA thioesterase-1
LLILQLSCSESTENDSKKKEDSAKHESDNEVLNSSKKKNIIFFGDSLTAGYGLDEASSDSYPAIIEQKIDSLGLNYKVINAGLSGETTAGGNERVNWVIRQPLDIFILALGGNDGLRGIAPESSAENLQSIIDKVKQKYPSAKIVLSGMQAPPNMGETFTEQFKNMYPSLAQKNELAFVPFLLENVGGIPSLNQRDGIHPNIDGHKILAETVWSILSGLL